MRVNVVGFLAGSAAALMLAPATAALGAGAPAPSSFTLSAAGPVSRGVIVKPVLRQRRDLGLVVFKEAGRTTLGTVVLGAFSGRPSIHWNLKVNGRLLGSGSYEISVRVFSDGRPARVPAPPSRTLTISRHTVHVG